MLMSTFIVSMWQVMDSNMNSDAIKNFIKRKLFQKQPLIKNIFGNNMENLLPANVCNMKRADL